jgi:3-deoxy-7-phosphoheptulonate synthase
MGDTPKPGEIPKETSDIRIKAFERLRAPAALLKEYPLTRAARETIRAGREGLRAALKGQDTRFVVITGPCSIHDPHSALEYANRLATLQEKVADELILVMRVYFEKPRTTIGWKGFVYDPARDQSNDMNRGLEEARGLLLAINELGLPCATEFLDPIVPQYVGDLISWAAIGARTTESQTHRQMASGLSMPVGFKNSTDGSLQVAIDAMIAASAEHGFLGINEQGQTCVVRTAGNNDTHIVLRGGGGRPNYSRADVAFAKVLMEEAGGNPRGVMVDCSHANSAKDFRLQPAVFENVLKQFQSGENALLGVMLESHLVEGRQSLGQNLTYGQSITDGCINWECTEELLLRAHAHLAKP